MDCARLVEIVPRDRWIFHYLNNSRLARFLVVLDAVTDSQIKASDGYCLELKEKLGLEHTVDKWVGLLGRANAKSEPIVFESGGADISDHTNRNGAFGGDDKGVVDDALHNDVHGFAGQH